MTSEMSIIGDGAENASKPQLQEDPPSSGESSRNVKVLGYCLLTDRQLVHYYKLHLISDAELATAGMDRSSLIDNYRRMHEESQKRPLPQDVANQVRELKLRLGIRPHKAYKFQLINQMVRLMDSVPDPRVIFPEMPMQMQFNFDDIYWESESVRRLAPEERVRRRFDAFYDYLDHQFVNGDRDKVLEVVVDALIRLTKRRLQASHKRTIASGYMTPRSFDLIPLQRGRCIKLLDPEGPSTRDMNSKS